MNAFILLACAIITTVVAQGGGQGGYHEEHHAHPKYHFAYAVHDSKTSDIKHHWESRDGDKVEGYYSFVQPDHKVRKVKYVADKNGFHADVQYDSKSIQGGLGSGISGLGIGLGSGNKGIGSLGGSGGNGKLGVATSSSSIIRGDIRGSNGGHNQGSEAGLGGSRGGLGGESSGGLNGHGRLEGGATSSSNIIRGDTKGLNGQLNQGLEGGSSQGSNGKLSVTKSTSNINTGGSTGETNRPLSGGLGNYASYNVREGKNEGEIRNSVSETAIAGKGKRYTAIRLENGLFLVGGNRRIRQFDDGNQGLGELRVFGGQENGFVNGFGGYRGGFGGLNGFEGFRGVIG